MLGADVPPSTNILVIGGGPAGSFAATALAREGFEVTLLERERFPRYHIGESMLPSCRLFLRFIGAEEKVKDHGFCLKATHIKCLIFYTTTHFETDTDFTYPDPDKAAWNVTRADFDEILLKHASENGVHVCEGIRVTVIQFSHENLKQPVSADWTSDSGSTGQVKFNWLVDASGRNGIMSTQYLKNRKFNQALRNIAYWGYWTGTGMYAPGTRRENAVWSEALTDESGWAWFIPLKNGITSVGIVIKEDANRTKKASLSGHNTNLQHYHNQLKLVPGITGFLTGATFLGEVKSAGDFSYTAEEFAGPHYRIAGDAGGQFIDPFLSSGVHLAFAGGLSAASSIAASIRGHCVEDEAVGFHNKKSAISYTRYLLVVLSAYRQITAQSQPVMSDIDEDNFDRAFDFIRPVIQGGADTDAMVTEAMMQRTMDFCERILYSDPDMQKEVSKRVPPALLKQDGPILGLEDITAIAGDDEEVRAVLHRVNARKAAEATHWQPNFRGESINGWSIVLEVGNLGLTDTSADGGK
ncbi:putative halogenase [Mycena galopus ATCC 62051]|nr:putative halogenase [Mycena galopus ATCC 62051]